MPAIDFPSSPSIDDEYTFAGKTWKFNGVGWYAQAFFVSAKRNSFNSPPPIIDYRELIAQSYVGNFDIAIVATEITYI